jgi:hypothetical protein
MQSDYQLIGLYCDICQYYDSSLAAEAQRQSNNFCPKVTDEECITIYIWGLQHKKYDVKAVYEFIKEFYEGWFPELPSYQAFNKRICYLSDALRRLADLVVSHLEFEEGNDIFVIDSMPIVVANAKRSSSAKTAPEICDKSYCASKGMWYYGVKLHGFAQRIYEAVPIASLFTISQASENDLPVAKRMLDDVRSINLFADKAYIDKQWIENMQKENQTVIFTPIKLQKGEKFLNSADKLFSSAVSQVRQPIESFFNWMNKKTKIQDASYVRSTNGLLSFIYARIASCYI